MKISAAFGTFKKNQQLANAPVVFVSPRASIPSIRQYRHSLASAVAVACALVGAALPLRAADVTIQPASGSGFVVKDATGANDRLRVQESGAISLPGIAAAPAQPQGLCVGVGGELGPCSSPSGTNYTAGTGLTLSGTAFSVAPTYRLPQGCTANQIAQWDGTAWNCAALSSGPTLPTGTTNQTLRYDASNTLVANPLFQAFADGGVVAGGASGVGSIPATGAGARLMWYPALFAFRAGAVQGAQWDEINMGSGSAAWGFNTVASGENSTAMGGGAQATGQLSTAMGNTTTASGNFSTAMGYRTTASGAGSTAMGVSTTASGDYSTTMGLSTLASGAGSTAMGSTTKAIGKYATAMGYNAVADGDTSIAIGRNVGSGGYGGSFIFGDKAVRIGIANDRDNQFLVFASGGIYLYSGMDIMGNPIGAALASGTSSWTTISDRNAKTAVQPVDARDVLKKVAALPLNTWQYKTQEAKYRHMGPMAQDFYSAFHLGESDKGIDTVDADGVALAAIQGLHAELADKDREISVLRAELSAQKSRVAALESVTRDVADMKAEFAAWRSAPAKPVAVALRLP